MVFESQRSPYKTEYESVVVSCTPSQFDIVSDGKKQKVNGFEIILEDTVFFAEGGGQPDDRGYLNEVPVLQVKRKGKDAIHYTKDSLEPGTAVVGKIDWKRRWDHMQQHSGQHLITAVADKIFGFKTTSWWLGDLVSHIELDTTNISDEQLQTLEEAVNEKIREAVPVEVKVYENVDEALKEARTRGLPADHRGPVRVVSMVGIDDNMCCGTHVSNLSHLQMIKLLHCEKGKKNKTNLFFLSGNRVREYIKRTTNRENQLTALLKNSPEEHVDLVKKLQATVKINQKTLQTLMKELASVQAEKIKAEKPKYCYIHRKEGDNDFVSVLLNDLSSEDIVVLVTTGEDNGGQMAFVGTEDVVANLGPKICQVFGGKGAAKGKRFSAKVTQLNLAARSQAENILREHFQ